MTTLKLIGIISDMLFKLTIGSMILHIFDPNPPTHIVLIVMALATLSGLRNIPKED